MMIRALAGTLAFVLSFGLLAQTPYLVHDINTTVLDSIGHSVPRSFASNGGPLLFSATHSAYGAELWKYENGQATLVKDIFPGTTSGSPGPIVHLGNGVFLFAANDGVHGVELWRTDGTAAGTYLVKDIHPTAGAGIVIYAVRNNRLLFSAADGVHGRELWTTDGTEAGTQLVYDFDGTSTSGVSSLFPFGDRHLVIGPAKIWLTDGTAAGTSLIANLRVRAAAVNGSTIFLSAYDVEHGYELWTSDGTEANTRRVTDLRPGPEDSLPAASMTRLGNGVLFMANDGANGLDLWKSDGTTAGTELVTNVFPAGTCFSCRVPVLRPALGLAFFDSAAGFFRTDGTEAGTFRISAYGFFAIPAFSRLFFFDSTSGRTVLRSTDGTVAGTATVVDMPSMGTGIGFGLADGKLYFSGTATQTGSELWVSDDGTAATTRELANINPEGATSSSPRELTAAGNQLFFFAKQNGSEELWRTDGTFAGTRKVLTNVTPSSLRLDLLTGFGESLYFRHSGTALWRSDGTSETTAPISGTPSFNSIFAGPNRLYLNAYASPYWSLWFSNGTAAGTLLSEPKIESPGDFAEFAGRVYFSGSTDSARSFWMSEGTPQTTRRLWSFPTDVTVNVVGSPVAAGGALFFVGSGLTLWRTDGTVEGTRKVRTASVFNLTGAGRYLYFTTHDPESGVELWRSDGTDEGTFLLRDIHPGSSSSGPGNLAAVGDLLFFTASDGVNGMELWRTDGTAAGTILVRDIAPGATPSTPWWLKAADGLLWFAANDGANGVELWRSDGTAEGTFMVADVAAGAPSSSPQSLTVAGRQLYFSAADYRGRELWAMPLAASAISIADARVVEGSAGSVTMQFAVTRSGSTAGAASAAFTTADGTAVAGSDYTATAGTVSFAAGETSKTIAVTVQSDTTGEVEEALYVVLSAPAGAALVRSRGTGLVEDDDRRADLSIELAGESAGVRSVRIHNAGPFAATGVRLRVTESPGIATFHACGVAGPCVLDVAAIAAGGFVDVSVGVSLNTALSDPDRPAGYTITGSVTATESDPNPADNVAFRRRDLAAAFLLPPFMATGSTFAGRYRHALSQSIVLGSSSPVVQVDVPNVPPPQTDPTYTAFTLTAGNTPGTAILTATENGIPRTRIALDVVAPGQTAKLDVAMTVHSAESYPGQPMPISVTMAAMRHDGTRPTGILTLRDEIGNVVAEAPLDANGSAVLNRYGAGVGYHRHSVHYAGDGVFHPARVDAGLAYVKPWATTTVLSLTRTACRMAEGTVTVRASGATTSPNGRIRVMRGSVILGYLTLTPTGIAGESRATVRVNLADGSNAISVTHETTASFNASSAATTVTVVDCAGFATALYLVTPCRVFDSRDSSAVTAAAPRAVAIAGACGIPATAKAVAVNVTAVSPSETGFLRLAPGGLLPIPATSTMNYRTGRTRANNAVMPLPNDGKLEVFNGGTLPVHVVIDVTGYFQ